jgi:hypothetical protein
MHGNLAWVELAASTFRCRRQQRDRAPSYSGWSQAGRLKQTFTTAPTSVPRSNQARLIFTSGAPSFSVDRVKRDSEGFPPGEHMSEEPAVSTMNPADPVEVDPQDDRQSRLRFIASPAPVRMDEYGVCPRAHSIRG